MKGRKRTGHTQKASARAIHCHGPCAVPRQALAHSQQGSCAVTHLDLSRGAAEGDQPRACRLPQRVAHQKRKPVHAPLPMRKGASSPQTSRGELRSECGGHQGRHEGGYTETAKRDGYAGRAVGHPPRVSTKPAAVAVILLRLGHPFRHGGDARAAKLRPARGHPNLSDEVPKRAADAGDKGDTRPVESLGDRPGLVIRRADATPGRQVWPADTKCKSVGQRLRRSEAEVRHYAKADTS